MQMGANVSYWNWFWECRGYCELESPRYRFTWEKQWQHNFDRIKSAWVWE